MVVNGESNINSGELVNSWGSRSPAKDLLVSAGDTADATAGLSAVVDEADLEAVSATLLANGEVGSPAAAYTHSRSDFEHVTQRGRSSSHFTRRLRHVRLSWSVSVKIRSQLRQSPRRYFDVYIGDVNEPIGVEARMRVAWWV
jgi:hypothetical protein